MPGARPYSSLSTHDIAQLLDAASPETVADIRHELSSRRTRAARKLLATLDTRGSGARPTRQSRSKADPQPTAHQFIPKFSPTDEQRQAMEKFATGQSLKISAFAGTGKTSTLQFLAGTRASRGLYLAFNRPIAHEARNTFPNHVDCRTTHSLASRHVLARFGFNRSKMFDSIGAKQLANLLELKNLNIEGQVTLTPVQIAFMLLRTVRQFCTSADAAISINHVPTSRRLLGLECDIQTRLIAWIAEQAATLWQHMQEPNDPIPLGHDGYLKLWSLSNPRLDFEYLLLDEAQDTNPVVLHVLKQQTHAQMVYVGDQFQQIYEWRGAVNAMAQMPTVHEVKLTQSFRFGPAIANAASRVLATLGESEPLRGFDRIDSSIVSPTHRTKAVLCRTNSTVIAEALEVLNRSQVPHIVGGTQELEILVQDVYRLMDGVPASHLDFFGCLDWDDVLTFANTNEGEDLRPFVSLVQQNGIGRLYAAVSNAIADETRADVVISTAHKAKGREWPSVRIAEDFSSSRTQDGRIPASEARLFYVAITRAKALLSINPELLEAFCSGVAFDVPANIEQPIRANPVPPPLPSVPVTLRRPDPEPLPPIVEPPLEPEIPMPETKKRSLFGRLFGRR